ncbi:MAG: hypothetical protein H0W90_04120 [Actinobacteria bacterium]|nr:hypothetical protein [Actinomycetota bacterium]
MSYNERTKTGRYEARYDLRTLLDVVGAVAVVASPTAPGQISQREYDYARTRSGYADAPSGKQTAVRLKMPWRDVLALATDPTRDKDISLGQHLGDGEEEFFDASVVKAALRTVALRLGKKTLLPADYLEERTRMFERASLRRGHRSAPLLPTEGQIVRVAGSWDAALKIAGLDPRPRNKPTHQGVPIVQALELALESLGALPTQHELEIFARANGFSLAKKSGRWGDYVAQLRVSRDDWGKWTPTGLVPREQRPDYSKPVELGASFEPVRRRRHRWTHQECLDALVRLLAELSASERLTQRLYQQKARADEDLPPLSSLQRHGGFGAMLVEARKRQRRR